MAAGYSLNLVSVMVSVGLSVLLLESNQVPTVYM